MPITPPVAHANIDSAAWGIPMTNEVNRLTGVTAPSAWVQPALGGGFVHGATPVMYRKIGDTVYLRGQMVGTATFTTAFTLPAGFRPPADLALAGSGVAVAGYWQSCEFFVTAAGAVSISTTSMANGWPSFSFSTTP